MKHTTTRTALHDLIHGTWDLTTQSTDLNPEELWRAVKYTARHTPRLSRRQDRRQASRLLDAQPRKPVPEAGRKNRLRRPAGLDDLHEYTITRHGRPPEDHGVQKLAGRNQNFRQGGTIIEYLSPSAFFLTDRRERACRHPTDLYGAEDTIRAIPAC